MKKRKSGKAEGIDGIRAEVMKQLMENRNIRKSLTRACNLCLDEKVNRRWLESKTTMIAKTKKPKNKEHRPIAVTICSTKIMCGFWREKIEEHLEKWAYGYEQQYGFTSGGRVENCLYTLYYIANRTYDSGRNKHKTLYFATIDFKKAYDSVDRKELIKVLIKYGVNTKIIDMIVQMYAGDKTTITLGGMEETIDVTSGRRQGCSISTILFKMITFNIIEDLEK